MTGWCAKHNIKPKTYFNWQKKVFAAMTEQQRQQLKEPQMPEHRFAALSATPAQKDLVAAIRIGKLCRMYTAGKMPMWWLRCVRR